MLVDARVEVGLLPLKRWLTGEPSSLAGRIRRRCLEYQAEAKKRGTQRLPF